MSNALNTSRGMLRPTAADRMQVQAEAAADARRSANRITPREAAATYMGEDLADLNEYVYQPGRTGGVTVYSHHDVYVFVLAVGKVPPRSLAAAFPDTVVTRATGSTADYIASRDKQVWLISQVAA